MKRLSVARAENDGRRLWYIVRVGTKRFSSAVVSLSPIRNERHFPTRLFTMSNTSLTARRVVRSLGHRNIDW